MQPRRAWTGLGRGIAALVLAGGSGLAGCTLAPAAADRALPPEVATVQIGRYPMAFVTAGQGPTVVLVHGAAADYRYWGPQLATQPGSPARPLSQALRAVSVSLRHHYPERWDARGGQYTPQRHAGDLIEFIERLPHPVHLVGHDRGGLVALAVARARPDLVGRLVLVEPTLRALSPAEEAAGTDRARQADALEQRLRTGDADAALAGHVDAEHGEGAWAGWSDAARQAARDNAATLPAVLREPPAALGCAELAALRMPVLLVAGELTRPHHMRTLAEAAKCVPHAERVVVAKAGHRVNLDNPIGFNDAVARFLRQ